MSDGPRLLAPAWFRHRLAGRVRLGGAIPTTGGIDFFDLGDAEEMSLLASAGLTAERLAERLDAGERLDQAPVFEVPVARPGKILCLGKNFAAHAAEFGAAVPEEPIFFTKLPDTLLPHEGVVQIPHWLQSRVDHEVELAVILGFPDPEQRGRKYVASAEALSLVAGYSILNDVTARAMQGTDRGAQRPWLRCKSFDTFCPLGPWVVPADALPQVHDLEIGLTVNGDQKQHSRTSLMVVGIAEAIAYLSRHTTLRPGDLIAMGTPAGVSALAPGDRMVASIEHLGELVNTVQLERE
ncbi:MAG: fumarylacetoacetate hydrolase family protein [Planctomycetota bacterium]